MNSLEYTTVINTLATLITDSLDADEASVLSAMFTQLGDTITTILAIRMLN